MVKAARSLEDLGMSCGSRPLIRSDGNYIRCCFYVEDGAVAYMLLAACLGCTPERHGETGIRNQAAKEIHDQYLYAEKARNVLDWKLLFALDQGLKATTDWYRDCFNTSHDWGVS